MIYRIIKLYILNMRNGGDIMIPRLYYELIYKNKVFATVYNEDDIIIAFYNKVNGSYGLIDPNDIIIKPYINGKEVKHD